MHGYQAIAPVGGASASSSPHWSSLLIAVVCGAACVVLVAAAAQPSSALHLRLPEVSHRLPTQQAVYVPKTISHAPAVVDSAEDAAPEDYAAPWAAAQDSGPVPAAPAGRGLGAAALAAAVLAACAWVIRAAGRRGPLWTDTPYLSMASVTGQAVDVEVDALVVGSGISGSCTAWNLLKNQGVANLLLVERNPVVGGNVISRADGEFIWEEGPNSFQPTPAIMRTVYELGLVDELVLADGSLPRFVYWEGGGASPKPANLHALPTNLPGDLLDFNLLTIPGKIRAAFGALGFIAPAPPAPYEESVREFVTRHLGEETFERVIDPFVSGVYAGDPDQLAMRAALKKIHRLEGLGDLGPGLVSGAINRFKEVAKEKRENPADPAWPTYRGGQLGSFRKGLQTLPNAVAQRLGADRVKTSWALRQLERDGPGFRATFDTPEGPKVVRAKSVSVTAPTRVAAEVCAGLVPAASDLAKVYSPPVASVTIAYRKEWFKALPGAQPGKPLVGFGHLLPRSMGVRSLGTIWSSSLFPGRAPEGWELLLTYIGGARDKGIAEMSVEEIVKQVDADNHKILLKPDAPAGKLLGCRVWQTAIPQYCRGHLDILAALERDEAKVPGLFLGGNYRTGVAFGDCVQFGLDEAAKIGAFLATAK